MKTAKNKWNTREIKVGNVLIGGDNPVRIQSMTTSNTRDIEATIDQIVKLADQGCEIARVTVQGKKEALACEEIKNGLVKRGYTIPIVADIHFYPPAAMLVADFVDKVRVNPGNYIDKRAVFKQITYSDLDYAHEIEKIEEGFSPLVQKCKQRKIAMRIGTNHGSLSDRIMNRYGDTAFGMVESALEFANVCRKNDYHNFLFSMKASNPLVMIQAYRLLVAKMMELGWDYPLHLGVTEAGIGEDGRVKSAVGIGSLLLDGIGDTIRCSLTEDPWFEIDPCKRLAKLKNENNLPYPLEVGRKKHTSTRFNLHPDGSVFLKLNSGETFIEADNDQTPDVLVVDKLTDQVQIKDIPILSLSDLKNIAYVTEGVFEGTSDYILLELSGNKVEQARDFFYNLKERGINIPVILIGRYQCSEKDLVIRASAEIGSLLADGFGEGICIVGEYSQKLKVDLSFRILQAARMRSSKTEFIACPGCGRTLFDLQSVTQKIRSKTSHLPGVKIAIMGCIVNGPGEMADADFGYVGSRSNKIDLYVGKTCVEKNIDESIAVDKLIALIKSHGCWVSQPTIDLETEKGGAKKLPLAISTSHQD